MQEEANLGPALLQAAQAGDAAEVWRLLGAGAPPNWRASGGLVSSLVRAVERASDGSASHARIACFLLAAGAWPDLPDVNGSTPLMAAAKGSDTQASEAMVRRLYEAGASLEQADCRRWTALAHALAFGNAGAADALLSRGAATDLPPGWREQHSEDVRLTLAWAAAQGRVRVLRAFAQSSADLEPPAAACTFQPLAWAAAAGQAECVALLLERGADAAMREGKERTTALHAAAAAGHGVVVRLLLESAQRRELVHARDSQGLTPLMAAAARGHTGVCGLLLVAGSNPDLHDWRRPAAAGASGIAAAGLTALQHAILGPGGLHHDTVRLLAAAAADSQPARGWPGAGLDARDKYLRRTALHWAAAVEGGFASDLVSRVLIKAGADEDAKDARGLTPLDLGRKRTAALLRRSERRWRIAQAE